MTRTIIPDDPAMRRCKLLKIAEVAHLIGCDRSTVYRLAARVNRPLPIVHIGGMSRVPIVRLENWLAEETEENGR